MNGRTQFDFCKVDEKIKQRSKIFYIKCIIIIFFNVTLFKPHQIAICQNSQIITILNNSLIYGHMNLVTA